MFFLFYWFIVAFYLSKSVVWIVIFLCEEYGEMIVFVFRSVVRIIEIVYYSGFLLLVMILDENLLELVLNRIVVSFWEFYLFIFLCVV